MENDDLMINVLLRKTLNLLGLSLRFRFERVLQHPPPRLRSVPLGGTLVLYGIEDLGYPTNSSLSTHMVHRAADKVHRAAHRVHRGAIGYIGLPRGGPIGYIELPIGYIGLPIGYIGLPIWYIGGSIGYKGLPWGTWWGP